MTNGNEPMYPTTGKEFINNSDHDITVGLYGGLTKREYFAANEKILPDDLSGTIAKLLMDTDIPKTFDLDAIKWWVEAEMKYRVMKADALINELNNTQSHLNK